MTTKENSNINDSDNSDYPKPRRPLEGEPGTPLRRLSYLLDNLEYRFPDACNPVMSYSMEPRYIKAIDDERREVNEALEAAITALDDWVNTYASELCDEERVKEAYNRLNEKGTLYYIASVAERCRKAIR